MEFFVSLFRFIRQQIQLIMAQLSIIHFNDVYNVDPNSSTEPIGGAARFLTAVKTFQHLNPLVLFSGDAFSPSMRKLSNTFLSLSSFRPICVVQSFN